MKYHYVDIAEGQIHYRTMGQGLPLILCHQAPMSGVEWEQIMPLLANDFTVYAPDMPGHGNSYEPGHALSMAEFGAQAIAFMDAVGIRQAYIAGNHSGAALSTYLAIHHPERITRAAISCEMLATTDQINAFLSAIKSKPLSRDIPLDAAGKFISDAWLRYEMLAPSAPLEVRYKPFIHGQLARLRQFDIHEAVLHWMSEQDWVAQLPCPTLIFGAEYDLFFDTDKMAEALTRIPNVQTVVIKNAGALSTFEQPEAVAQVLLTFFSDQ